MISKKGSVKWWILAIGAIVFAILFLVLGGKFITALVEAMKNI